MNWLKHLLFKQKRLVKPTPTQARPFSWYRIEGSVPHATVYLVIDRRGNTSSRHVVYNN